MTMFTENPRQWTVGLITQIMLPGYRLPCAVQRDALNSVSSTFNNSQIRRRNFAIFYRAGGPENINYSLVNRYQFRVGRGLANFNNTTVCLDSPPSAPGTPKTGHSNKLYG